MPVLDFKGKSVAEFHHRTVPHHRLEFDAGASLLPGDAEPDLNGNLVIEGDNLRALKALLPTHRGRVKCVYIDPPYNTGNEDWVYNDNLTQPQFKEWIGKEVGKEGEDALRHDKWCCMMYPRLKLLRDLLHEEEGLIFVSCDDNEVHHLRLIMNDVFGEENWLATLMRRAMHTVRNSSKDFNLNGDYVVAFARDKPWLEAKKERYIRQPMDKADNYPLDDDDGKGPYKLDPLHARNYYEPYVFTFANGVEWEAPEGRYPAYAPETLRKKDAAGEIVFNGGSPQAKRYLREVQEGRPPDAYLDSDLVKFNATGTTLLRRMLGAAAFDQPKPVELVQHLLTLIRDPNAVVLDSFAGSGTTAHAVLAQNAADGGNRKFVLVQQRWETLKQRDNGTNICRDVTRQRVANAALGYAYTERGKTTEVPGLGGSFTYATLGDPLLTDYRTFAGDDPDFATLAAYVFYTETGRQADPAAFDEATGFVGATDERGGAAYYLLYTPNDREDMELSPKVLNRLADAEDAAGTARPHWVVYAERMWIRPQQQAKFEAERDRSVRRMLVPFGLK